MQSQELNESPSRVEEDLMNILDDLRDSNGEQDECVIVGGETGSQRNSVDLMEVMEQELQGGYLSDHEPTKSKSKSKQRNRSVDLNPPEPSFDNEGPSIVQDARNEW
jgi:hypothetical protein